MDNAIRPRPENPPISLETKGFRTTEHEFTTRPKKQPSRLETDLASEINDKHRVLFEVSRNTYGIQSALEESRGWPTARETSDTGSLQTTNVLLSKRIVDLDREQIVELHCLPETPEPLLHADIPQFRWLHIRSNPMNLEEFERLALCSPGISKELKDLCVSLFVHIRAHNLIESGNALQIEPGTVKRFNLRDTGKIEEECMSATFSSFPYLSASVLLAGTSHTDDRHHRIRTLLETFYRYESTAERDRSQAFAKYFNNDGNDIIHVPQLWSLVLASSFLITCSPQTGDEILGRQLVKITKGQNESCPTLLRIQDPLGRFHSVPLWPIPAFFDLEHLVVSKCLAGTGMSADECSMCFGDGTAFTSTRWLELLRTHKGAMLEIRIIPCEDKIPSTSRVEQLESKKDLRSALIVARKRSRANLTNPGAATTGGKDIRTSSAMIRYQSKPLRGDQQVESDTVAGKVSGDVETMLGASILCPPKPNWRSILVNDISRIPVRGLQGPDIVYIRPNKLEKLNKLVEVEGTTHAPMSDTMKEPPGTSAAVGHSQTYTTPALNPLYDFVSSSSEVNESFCAGSDTDTAGPIESRIWEIHSDDGMQLLDEEIRMKSSVNRHQASFSEENVSDCYRETAIPAVPTGVPATMQHSVLLTVGGIVETANIAPTSEETTLRLGGKERGPVRFETGLPSLPSSQSSILKDEGNISKGQTSPGDHNGTPAVTFDKNVDIVSLSASSPEISGPSLAPVVAKSTAEPALVPESASQAADSAEPVNLRGKPTRASLSPPFLRRRPTIPLPAHVSDDDSDEPQSQNATHSRSSRTAKSEQEPVLFEAHHNDMPESPTFIGPSHQRNFHSGSSDNDRYLGGDSTYPDISKQGKNEDSASEWYEPEDSLLDSVSEDESIKVKSGASVRASPLPASRFSKADSGPPDRAYTDDEHLSDRPRRPRRLKRFNYAPEIPPTTRRQRRTGPWDSEDDRANSGSQFRGPTERLQSAVNHKQFNGSPPSGHHRARPSSNLASHEIYSKSHRQDISINPFLPNWANPFVLASGTQAMTHGPGTESLRHDMDPPSPSRIYPRKQEEPRLYSNPQRSDIPYIPPTTNTPNAEYLNPFWAADHNYNQQPYQPNKPYFPPATNTWNTEPLVPPWAADRDQYQQPYPLNMPHMSPATNTWNAGNPVPFMVPDPDHDQQSYPRMPERGRSPDAVSQGRRAHLLSTLKITEERLAHLQAQQDGLQAASPSRAGVLLGEKEALNDTIADVRLQLSRSEPLTESFLLPPPSHDIASITLPSLRENIDGGQQVGEEGEFRTLNLQVPPFLSWATQSNEMFNSNGFTTNTPLNGFDSVEYVLKKICERLTVDKSYGTDFIDAPKLSYDQFQERHSTSSSMSQDLQSVSNAEGRDGTRMKASSVIQDNDEVTSGSRDYVTETQRLNRNALRSEILSLTRRLASLFVPLEHIHEVMSRYWGLVDSLCSILDGLVPQEPPRNIWVVRIIKDESEILTKYELASPSPALSNCSECQNGRMYPTERAGIRHLWYQHFMPSASRGSRTGRPPKDALKNWIRSEEQLRSEFYSLAMSRILRPYLEYLTRTCVRTRSIHNGVADSEKTKSDKYGLPATLVEVFKLQLSSLLCVRKYMNRVQLQFQQWRYLPSSEDLETVLLGLANESALKIQSFLHHPDSALSEAEKDFSLMAHTPSLATVSLASVGPEYILAAMIEQLRASPIKDDLDDVDLYRHCTERLQYQVHTNPHKRLLRDIQYVHEEVEILILVNKWQTDLYIRMLKALNPASAPVTTQTRLSIFPFERMLLDSGLSALKSKAQELDAMGEKLRNLRQSAVQNIEIDEADHGKAIFVFTTVTIIFLPLSFVTSFFGMNTTDIRDITWSQSIFWTTATPITLLTVVLALVLAYKGDQVQVMFRRMVSTFSRSNQASHGMSPFEKETQLRRPPAVYRGSGQKEHVLKRARTDRSYPLSLH